MIQIKLPIGIKQILDPHICTVIKNSGSNISKDKFFENFNYDVSFSKACICKQMLLYVEA
jgi:hypothetical protein